MADISVALFKTKITDLESKVDNDSAFIRGYNWFGEVQEEFLFAM
jgi:hypothetical protein